MVSRPGPVGRPGTTALGSNAVKISDKRSQIVMFSETDPLAAARPTINRFR
jgi:hypothetical protein